MKNKNVAGTAEPSCLVGNPRPADQTNQHTERLCDGMGDDWESPACRFLRFPLAFNLSTQLFWGWENSNEQLNFEPNIFLASLILDIRALSLTGLPGHSHHSNSDASSLDIDATIHFE